MECLILRYRSNSQTSNKLNTIAIPLAATSLCMVANIVLALSFGEVMFPHILLTSLSVFIKLHYIRYTGISSSLVECGTHVNRFALPPPLSNLFGYIFGSSGKWSDKVCIERKKTAEHFVYLNNHKQIYNNEQQFSISCMGALQP